MITYKKAYNQTFKKEETYRAALVEAIIKAGTGGLTADQVLELTQQKGENPYKLARQSMRRARWALFEKGYRLAKDEERLEGGYVVYRAIKIEDGVRMTTVFKEKEVIPFSIKVA